MDNVIIKNRFGFEFEVTRKHAEKLVSNGDIKEKDIVEIESIKEPTEEQVLRAEYKEKFGKNVPPNKAKDTEWIKSKLSENTAE